MKKIIAILRGLVVFPLALLLTLPGMFKSMFSKNWLPLALDMRQLWANISLFTLGVDVKIEGKIPKGGPYLFVGNHRSYIDPIVALKDVQALPVAKAEVSSWPIIGYAAKATGIMWVKRESRSSRANTLKAMLKTIEDGYSVLVYPEGTTHIENQTQEFKRGAFRVAVDEGIPVVPMAIEYLDKGDAWVGDDTFLPHFVRCFGKSKTKIRMAYGEPITHTDAKELVKITKNWIDGYLKKWNS